MILIFLFVFLIVFIALSTVGGARFRQMRTNQAIAETARLQHEYESVQAEWEGKAQTELAKGKADAMRITAQGEANVKLLREQTEAKERLAALERQLRVLEQALAERQALLNEMHTDAAHRRSQENLIAVLIVCSSFLIGLSLVAMTFLIAQEREQRAWRRRYGKVASDGDIYEGG